MKLIFGKKMVRQTHHKKKGFALLFSVLVSSLLLTIGLSIFGVALKELAISTASRQSIHAFYAADSGREYALYRDTKLGDIFTQSDIVSIIDGTPVGPENILSTDVDEVDGPNFKVEIRKEKNSSTLPVCGAKDVCTTVISYGYDSNSGDRVERAIQDSY